ncbi:type II toxin-antitoxin system PemK/MazF family toxin [Bifidobacterium sp. ESL0769]|uniref:type II toxin-antitoxin system PemK/MazF family toxin n=1 Tax=Bifidobacterium sp. ESL0769 TaxID=2983229 RepID=UPI0023F84CC1|nr:type II toxin-antitoxin system PemK/MazF family toxin [Bifidobacterium sp. ESL0769]WEV68251.1 type II toxin-antitoxin system PemK/MazF family toxin [Bifidobacterium sp. ESL0769]
MVMQFFKGDVICTDFQPSKGHEQTKRRYAVVISNDDFNKECNLQIVCPISNGDNGFPLHFNIEDSLLSGHDTRYGKLSGFVQVEQMKSFDLNARDTEYVGRLSPVMMRKLTSTALSCLY